VGDILHFMIGRRVDIVGSTRIGGQFQAGRIRPVLLKLRSVAESYHLLDKISRTVELRPDALDSGIFVFTFGRRTSGSVS
jgi:hypothetical protein